MHIFSMDFDLIVANPMRDSVVTGRMLKICPMIIGNQDMPIDLVILNLQDFDVI